MVKVLEEALGARLAEARVLNLGCSTGIIDELIAEHVLSATGVDIDVAAIDLAKSRPVQPNVTFQVDDAMALSFADAAFDVVVCSQVYEHVPDSSRMMSEINRVLRPGGLCYFAATNRWALVEKHHRLPFLSWLPPSLADRYMRASGKGSAYYERHLGYADLLQLTSEFRLEDYTGKILAEPDRYAAGYLFGGRARTALARTMFRAFRPLFPGYIWLLWKREGCNVVASNDRN